MSTEAPITHFNDTGLAAAQYEGELRLWVQERHVWSVEALEGFEAEFQGNLVSILIFY